MRRKIKKNSALGNTVNGDPNDPPLQSGDPVITALLIVNEVMIQPEEEWMQFPFNQKRWGSMYEFSDFELRLIGIKQRVQRRLMERYTNWEENNKPMYMVAKKSRY